MAGKTKNDDISLSDKDTRNKKQKPNEHQTKDTTTHQSASDTCNVTNAPGKTEEFKRKNCMKHKKKDKNFEKKKFKKHRKQKKGDKSNPNEEKDKTVKATLHKPRERIKLPTEANEISANWKQLLEQSKELKEERKKAKKRKLIRKRELSPPPPPPVKEEEESKPADIWFDDVDELLIESLRGKKAKTDTATPSESQEKDEKKEQNPLVKPESFAGPTKVIAMDCEMVGVGEEGKDSILARVSLVNQYGQCIYDKFVKASETVTDYRTFVSGVRPEDMVNGEDFDIVQREVFDLLKGRTLVGHALSNDLKVLYLDHPHKMIRDTSTYRPFRALFKGRRPALRKLSDQVLKVPIQTGEHSSVQDAQAAMRLYTMYRKQWEKELKFSPNSQKMKKKKSPAVR